MTESRAMGHDRIVEMLRQLAERCEAADIQGEIHLVGGAALALAFDARRTTGDLDGAFEPKSELYRMAASIAEEQDLDPNWLNDGAKAFIPASGEAATTNVYLDTPGLIVRTGSAKQLFVMKAVSGRDSDLDDLRLLYKECGFTDPDHALDLVQRTYPPAMLTPAVQHMVHAAAPEPIAERMRHTPASQTTASPTTWLARRGRLAKFVSGLRRKRR